MFPVSPAAALRCCAVLDAAGLSGRRVGSIPDEQLLGLFEQVLRVRPAPDLRASPPPPAGPSARSGNSAASGSGGSDLPSSTTTARAAAGSAQASTPAAVPAQRVPSPVPQQGPKPEPQRAQADLKRAESGGASPSVDPSGGSGRGGQSGEVQRQLQAAGSAVTERAAKLANGWQQQFGAGTPRPQTQPPEPPAAATAQGSPPEKQAAPGATAGPRATEPPRSAPAKQNEQPPGTQGAPGEPTDRGGGGAPAGASALAEKPPPPASSTSAGSPASAEARAPAGAQAQAFGDKVGVRSVTPLRF